MVAVLFAGWDAFQPCHISPTFPQSWGHFAICCSTWEARCKLCCSYCLTIKIGKDFQDHQVKPSTEFHMHTKLYQSAVSACFLNTSRGGGSLYHSLGACSTALPHPVKKIFLIPGLNFLCQNLRLFPIVLSQVA